MTKIQIFIFSEFYHPWASNVLQIATAALIFAILMYKWARLITDETAITQNI